MAVAMYDEYLERINALVGRIAEEERDSIMGAAVAVADRVADDRLVNVIGPGGHSSMGAEEVFYRAGGLACVNALLDDGFLLAHGAVRSMLVERTPGYGRTVLRNANLSSGDILIIVNAYGVNSSTIDCALYARELGVTTIGVTSVELQRALPQGHAARHPGGQDLTDLTDFTIDTKVPVGDALMEVDGIQERVGAVSTFANSFALNALMLEAIAELARRKFDPPIWRSANSPGGDEANQAAIARYRPRVKRL